MTYIQDAFTGQTGARPISSVMRRWAQRFDELAGQDGDVERNSLYRILEGAKGALGLSSSSIETLKHVISFTRPEDWNKGRTPLAWPSNYTLAEIAGVSEGAIKARMRQLRAAGLIRHRDSGHGRRRGQRDGSGEIVSAFGLDLTPLKLRYDELREAADAASAQARLFKHGRQEFSRMRRLVGQALAQAAHMRLTGPHWTLLEEEMAQMECRAAAARNARDSDAYEAAIADLSVLEDLVGETIDRYMFSDDFDPSGSKFSPSIHIQTNPSRDSVMADQECSSDPAAEEKPEPDMPASPSNSRFKASAEEIAGLFPTAAMFIDVPSPDWRHLEQAAARLRPHLGIRPGTWLDAIEIIGIQGTVIAAMITAERWAAGQVRSTPGAYFAGMVSRARRGELDLARSLWGFRTLQ